MSEKTLTLLDMFGPVMIGPSSSHTAGIARLGFAARKIFASQPEGAKIFFYGSLARTYRGHGSDKAAVAGLLGILPDDERISFAFDLAERAGLRIEIKPEYNGPARYHVNTVVFIVYDKTRSIRLRGASIGGGEIRMQSINGYKANLDGSLDAVLLTHRDQVGVIALVSKTFADFGYNIAQISSFRKDKGDEALLVAEVDGAISSDLLSALRGLPVSRDVVYIPALRN